eukprot:TRINITY_DN177_c0_g2_i2.p1 TRINITY_DN177_c0_g2~~TRINITY_DN177_c0_g2_i2.p1  ORF type:complete len:207 (+),score=45.13 TRINITY_DN177_c0_g2_i2:54-623(+)
MCIRDRHQITSTEDIRREQKRVKIDSRLRCASAIAGFFSIIGIIGMSVVAWVLFDIAKSMPVHNPAWHNKKILASGHTFGAFASVIAALGCFANLAGCLTKKPALFAVGIVCKLLTLVLWIVGTSIIHYYGVISNNNDVYLPSWPFELRVALFGGVLMLGVIYSFGWIFTSLKLIRLSCRLRRLSKKNH